MSIASRFFCFATALLCLLSCGTAPTTALSDSPDEMAAEVNDTASDSAADSGDHNDTVGQGDGDVAEIDSSDTADTVLPTDTTTTDCPCGDGICGTSCGETEATCPADCKGCGNGVCEPGEGPKACAIDCCGACGDGKCKGYDCGENPQKCPEDCGNACGNKVCDKGESPISCAMDCVWQVCGNGVCEPEDGGPDKCPGDCATSCGDCVCDKDEDWLSCPVDCGYCGDKVCSPCSALGESKALCPGDCQSQGCVDGCDDGLACTVDICTSDGGCLHIIDATLCSDNNACTNDLCTASGCEHTADDGLCDDGNGCTADACALAEGCTHTDVVGGTCTDGDSCTVGDACSGGNCQAGEAVSCSDGNTCTDDSCTPSGCTHSNNVGACNDGNACSVNDTCAGGSCSGVAATCNDGDVCSLDYCDGLAGGCAHLPSGATTCDDGNPCTVGDKCLSAVCTGTLGNCDDDDPCTLDSCAFGNTCNHAPLSAGGCSDGDPCTSGESCQNGVCTDGSPTFWQYDATGSDASAGVFMRGGVGGAAVSRLSSGGINVAALAEDGSSPWQVTFADVSVVRSTPYIDVYKHVLVPGQDAAGNGWIGVIDATGKVIPYLGLATITPGMFAAVFDGWQGGGTTIAAAGWQTNGVNGGEDMWLQFDSVPVGNPSIAFGTAGDERAYAITNNGLTVGFFLAGSSTTAGNSQVYVVATDHLGNKNWSTTLGDAFEDVAYGVVPAGNSGCVVAGVYGVSSTKSDLWLVGLDASGHVRWQQKHDMGGGNEAASSILAASTSDGFVVAGNRGADGLVERVDAFGNPIWRKQYPGAPVTGMAWSTGYPVAVSPFAAPGLIVAQTKSAQALVQHLDIFGNDTCQAAGNCATMLESACKDGSVCSSNDCAQGACKNPAWSDAVACEDGDPCTTANFCVSGKCNTDAYNLTWAIWEDLDTYHTHISGILGLADGTGWSIANNTNAAVTTYWTDPYGAIQSTVPLTHAIHGAANSEAYGPFVVGADVGNGGDGWAARFDASTENWSMTIGGAGKDALEAVVSSPLSGADSGYWATGTTNSKGAGLRDCWLVHYFLNSTTATDFVFGSADDEACTGIAFASDNKILMVGQRTIGSAVDSFVVKTNTDGVAVWAVPMNIPTKNSMQTLAPTPDGGGIGIGTSYGDANGDMLLVRFDGSGNRLWYKIYASAGADLGYDIIPAGGGNWFLGGTFYQAATLWRVNSAGVIQSQHSYGSDGAIEHLATAGLFLYAGGHQGSDAWLARLDGFGNPTCSDSGDCLITPSGDCDDGNACTADTCSTSSCTHVPVADASPCGVAGTCTAGVCSE